MKLCCVLIFAAILLAEGKVHESDAREQWAAADIARLIHLVQQQADDEQVSEERTEPLQSFAEDYFMVRTEPSEDVFIQNEDNQAHVRLHFIKNPNVLEKYKKRIKSKSLVNGNTFGNDLYDLDRRRSALFRLGSSSINTDTQTRSDENILHSNSPENKKHDKRIDRNKNNVDIHLDNDEVRRKKGKSAIDNAWDVITKKYDWDKPKQVKKKKNKMADDWDVTKQNYDKWQITKRDRDSRVEKPKKIDWNSAERKPKKNYDRSHEQKNKIKATNYDIDTTFETTKHWKSEPKQKEKKRNKPYVPYIPSYDKPRKKKRDEYEGSAKFGRTPIPYIGRHGIYAD